LAIVAARFSATAAAAAAVTAASSASNHVSSGAIEVFSWDNCQRLDLRNG
jgi:hypothetical protein